MIGRSVFRYRILERLGGGGMAVAYKVEDPQLHHLVALKSLPDEWLAIRKFRPAPSGKRLAASALNHPNVKGTHCRSD